jgi:8-oxo-dGTP diphosphatase
MSGMCWLHLSDWHQSDAAFDRRKVRDALLKDIKGRRRINDSLDRIDFVVFSGDIAAHGRVKEYEAARSNLFDPVLEASGLGESGKAKLFLVPGNHDLDWNAFELDPAELLDKMGDPGLVAKWLLDPERRAALLRPFTNYSRFVTEYLGRHQDFVSSDPAYGFVRRLEISRKRISLVCLNSAWLSGRNKDKNGKVKDYGCMLVGEPQIHDAIDAARDSDVCIAVCHHPSNWLTERECISVQERLSKDCDFVLVGHQHYPQVRIEFSTIGDLIVMPAGASYDRIPQKGLRYPNTYSLNYLDLESGQGAIHIRRWSDRQNEWIPDTESIQNGCFEYTLPKLAPLDLQVSVAIVVRDHQVLLVKRREKENCLQWQFPGGVVTAGQTDKEAAEREAFGETNIKVRALRKIGQRVHPDTKVLVHYWLCEYISGSVATRDLKDLSEARWALPKTALKLITSNVYPEVRKIILKSA